MNAPVIVAIISGVVTLLASIVGVWSARRADKSATFTKTLEVGVTGLVNELQEERDHYRTAAAEWEGRYRELESSMHSLENKVEELKRLVNDKDKQIDRLKQEIGLS